VLEYEYVRTCSSTMVAVPWYLRSQGGREGGRTESWARAAARRRARFVHQHDVAEGEL
jgi:hypothetical protein